MDVLNITYDVAFYPPYDALIEHVVGAPSGDSGSGVGERDLAFYFESRAVADAAADRVKGLNLPGIRFIVVDESEHGDPEDRLCSSKTAAEKPVPLPSSDQDLKVVSEAASLAGAGTTGQLITLQGPLVAETCHALSHVLNTAFTAGIRHIGLHLGACRSMDDAGLVCVVRATYRLRRAGGDLCLIGVAGKMARLLDMMGCATLFGSYATLAEAQSAGTAAIRPTHQASELEFILETYKDVFPAS